MLTAEQLLEVAESAQLHRGDLPLPDAARRATLRPHRPCSPASRTWARSASRSAAASTAAGTSSTWPAATWPPSGRSSHDLDEKVKAEIQRLLRDPELRKILSYPNATVHGDHYVLPVSVNHRHKVPGVVHRVSSTGETLFVEPASIAGLSAERVQPEGRRGPRGETRPAAAQRRGGPGREAAVLRARSDRRSST